MKKDIFARLSRGESVPFTDPEYCKIHKAVEQTKKLSVKLNNTYDPDEIIRVLWERLYRFWRGKYRSEAKSYLFKLGS